MIAFLKQKLAYVLFIVCFSLLTIPNLLSQNLIGDESVYILEGDRYLHTPYSFYNNSGSPHLLKTITGIFLIPLPLDRQYDSYFTKTNTDVYTSANFTYDQNRQYAQQMIILSRIPHFILGLALGFALYIFTKKVASPTAGAIALVLYTFHPLFLSHAATSNLDLGTTAFAFFTLVSLYFYLQKSHHSKKLLILTGVLLGLAQMTKISGILLYPTFILYLLFTKNLSKWKQLAAIFGISIFTIWAGYAFQIGPIILPTDDPAGLESLYGWLPFKQQITDLLKSPIFPAGAWINNFTYQFTHSFYGHTVYLNGEFTDKGMKHYIPTLLLYKNSIIFLALTLVAFALTIKNKLYQKNHIKLMLLWTILILLWSTFGKLQLGTRYAMPFYPTLFVLIGITTASLWTQQTKKILVATLALYALSTLSIYPSFFTYTNELIRTQNPVNLISDSDYDWGQSVYKLGEYQKQHNLYPLYFKQFGGANLEFYKIQNTNSPEQSFAQKNPGYYAFSHSSLVGLKRDNPELFAYIASRTPQHIIDRSIYVYFITFN